MIPIEPAPWEPARAGNLLEDDTLEIWSMPADLNAQADQVTGLELKERAWAERMRSPARRAQYLAGHLLLNQLRARHGAPLFTSLAHSGEWVVAASARTGPVGIDVEFLQMERPLERLSRRFFTPEEHGRLAQSSSEEQVRIFYGLWTAKEALFKALGMSAGAAHFAERPVPASSRDETFPRECIVEGCRVGWFIAAPGYLGAYAAPAGVSRVRHLLPA